MLVPCYGLFLRQQSKFRQKLNNEEKKTYSYANPIHNVLKGFKLAVL